MNPDAARPPKQEQRAERVDDVIDVVAVARPLVTAVARQGAVEAVAEPVQGQADNDEHQSHRRESRQPERQTGAQHGCQRQSGQVVGIDAGGHSRRQKLKRLALGGR